MQNEQIENMTIRKNELMDVLDAIKKRENYVDKKVETLINCENLDEYFNNDKLNRDNDDEKISTVSNESTYRDHHIINKLDDKISGLHEQKKGI